MKSDIISTTSAAISSGGTITGDLTISGDLTVSGSGTYTYDEAIAGKLLVGSTSDSVDGTLHAHTATAGSVTAHADADDLIVENSASGGITILTPDASYGALFFGSPIDNLGAQVSYQQSSATMIIGTRLSSGKVNIRTGDGSSTLILDTNSRISLSNNDGGNTGNTIFGKSAWNCSTDNVSDYNTIFGEELMVAGAVAGATYNSGLGYRSLYNITAGDGNTALGSKALYTEDAGQYTVAVGLDAGYKQNVGAGDSANTIVGTTAGYFNVTGTNNTYIGRLAGYGADGQSNSNNVGVGSNALLAITDGSHNVAIGAFAGDAMTDNTLNVIIGKSAFSVADAGENYNVVIGGDAGTAINHADSDYNVLIGQDAGTGGAAAMISCVAIGGNAMNSTATNAQTGTIAIGHDALTALTTGVGNTAVGYQALQASTDGTNNTAIGYQALYQLPAGGLYNTAVGYSALSEANNADADRNTAVGRAAGDVITSGYENTIIGSEADPSAATGINQTVIGQSTTGVADNSVTLGNASVTDVYMSQDSQAYVHSQNVPNHVANTMSSPYYRFDGVNDEIAIADSAHLSFGDGTSDSPFSVSAWINMEDATDFRIITKGTYNSDAEWQLQVANDDKLGLSLYDESVASTYELAYTTATLTAYQGKWTHVVATYNGVGGTSANAGITIYINGVSQALTLWDAGTYVAMENLAEEVRIGNYNDATYAQGSIAGLKIHNHELSATEVKEDYSGASVPFKYKGANQTNLFDADAAAGTVVDNWTVYGSNTIAVVSSAITITYSNHASGAYIYLRDDQDCTSNTTKGKKYRFSCDAHYTGGSAGVTLFLHDGVASSTSDALTTGAVRQNIEFTAQSDTEVYLQLASMGASNVVTLDNLSLVPIGAVAEYDGSTAGAHKWGDKSGNDLHGTVGDGAGGATAPTLENTPYDSGTEYEEGTWTPVLVSGSTTITRSGGSESATYTRIGNMVTIQWSFYNITTAGSFENAGTTITGLPFTSGTAKIAHGSVFSIFGNTSFSAIPHFTRTDNSTTIVEILTLTATTYAIAEIDAVGSGTYGGFSMTYWV